MADELKTIKFQMMLSESEAKAIDDWGFANRIRSRAEAIRRLCQTALFYDDRAKEMAADADRLTEMIKDPASPEEEVIELAMGLAQDVRMLEMSRNLFSSGEKVIAMERAAAAREKFRAIRGKRVAAIETGEEPKE